MAYRDETALAERMARLTADNERLTRTIERMRAERKRRVFAVIGKAALVAMGPLVVVFLLSCVAMLVWLVMFAAVHLDAWVGLQ